MTYMTDLPTLTVWPVNSHSHDLASKSHDESENLEIAEQFQQKSLTNIHAFVTSNLATRMTLLLQYSHLQISEQKRDCLQPKNNINIMVEAA